MLILPEVYIPDIGDILFQLKVGSFQWCFLMGHREAPNIVPDSTIHHFMRESSLSSPKSTSKPAASVYTTATKNYNDAVNLGISTSGKIYVCLTLDYLGSQTSDFSKYL